MNNFIHHDNGEHKQVTTKEIT